MLRLFRYLGATDADMEEVERDIRRWGRGSVHLDVAADKLHIIGATGHPLPPLNPPKRPTDQRLRTVVGRINGVES